MSRLEYLAGRLRPRSDEGKVHRDERVESFELLFVGLGTLIAAWALVTSLARGDWLTALWFPTVVVALLAVARFLFFRPHVVIGPTVVVLVGVVGTRSIEFFRIRRAEAVVGGIRLELIDGSQVVGPGWRGHVGRDAPTWTWVASEINRRVTARYGDGDEFGVGLRSPTENPLRPPEDP